MNTEITPGEAKRAVLERYPAAYLLRGCVCPVNAAIMIPPEKCLHVGWQNGEEDAWIAAYRRMKETER